MSSITPTAHALQLTGPDRLRLNRDKPVPRPNPHQVLARVEAVGLCFSDLKLLKQFDAHPRKGPVLSGLAPEILAEIPSYVPGKKPGVPGHEAAVEIVAVGEKVKGIMVGERRLVQTDYRWLPTAESNGSFGYNFEGGLQEYVLMDQRVITSPEGDCLLIPASRGLSASAVALVEPWACVEDAYTSTERRGIRAHGRLMIAGRGDGDYLAALISMLRECPPPGRVSWAMDVPPPPDMPFPVTVVDACRLDADEYDDLLFFGADAGLLQKLIPLAAAGGLINIVLCGRKFGRPLSMPVGRVHYGGVRITGTGNCDPRHGYSRIPDTGEVRDGDRVQVVGAGGPMGVMHVIRLLCLDGPRVSVLASTRNARRRDRLHNLAAPLAAEHCARLRVFDPRRESPGTVDYVALMAPVPSLVDDAIAAAAQRGIINIFAGIPAEVMHPVDMDAYLRKELYFIGTSGSVIDDMLAVLGRAEDGRLDTNLSVAAVCGLDGAEDGIRAVERREVDGKIVCYPSCRGLGLTGLDELAALYPEIGAALDEGKWTAKSEKLLLSMQWPVV